MKNYRTLTVWKLAHALTLEVYRCSHRFPKEEVFALTAQIRRSSSSIGSNIAEGCGRDGDAELKRFLNVALGSACELDYQILLAGELVYLDPSDHSVLGSASLDLRQRLGAFIRTLKG